MFDPTSIGIIVIFSLFIMPIFSFSAYAVLLRRFKDSPDTCHRLTRRKTRVIFSLLFGVQMTLFFYLVSLVALWEYASIHSLSGTITRVLMFATLCGVGTYIGATVAGRLFRPQIS
jgi:hypothetical protein